MYKNKNPSNLNHFGEAAYEVVLSLDSLMFYFGIHLTNTQIKFLNTVYCHSSFLVTRKTLLSDNPRHLSIRQTVNMYIVQK